MSLSMYYDVSQYNGSWRPGPGEVYLDARATIGNERDTQFPAWVAWGASHGTLVGGYHFLNEESLGISPENQADFAYAVIGPGRPGMVDVEPNRGRFATPSQALRFIDRYRSHPNAILSKLYLPHWAWANAAGSNGWGQVGLQPFVDRGLTEVNSWYSTTYSDTSPGWQGFGGLPVTVLQWTSTPADRNAVKVDANAMIGLMMGGQAPHPGPPPYPPPLAVDGIMGPLTIRRWQGIMGTPQDGVIDQPPKSSMLVAAVQRRLNAAIGAGLAVDGQGICQDGHTRYLTTRALQRYLGTPQDGVLSLPTSMCVRALQVRLNQGRF